MAQENKKPSRREFLTDSGKAAAGLMAAGSIVSSMSAKSYGQIAGANERINIAVVGLKSRGGNHIDEYSGMKDVTIKTLCDIDENILMDRAKKLAEKKNITVKTEWEFRKVLDDKDIQAVSIATPNFWHALGTIWACQAKKHVYVEKPCCHNIFEGRKMVEAARKNNCLVEVGFQNRSIKNVRNAMKFLHDGGIGEVYMARGLCYKPRGDIGKCKDGVGSGEGYNYWAGNQKGTNYDKAYMDKVHYDVWQGPAQEHPFNYNRFHYNWHWNWDYGSGDIGNQGPHQFDIARWALNKNEHPVSITSFGGYYVFDSDQQTPNNQTASFKYADGKMLEFEVRGHYTNDEQGVKIGNIFYGTKGWMVLDGSSWKTFTGYDGKPGASSESADVAADPMNLAGAASGGHFANFIKALKDNDMKTLTCDIEEGFLSSSLPLLANISYRLGRTLTFDGKSEKFVNDKEADGMLTRNYRKPYVVPAEV